MAQSCNFFVTVFDIFVTQCCRCVCRIFFTVVNGAAEWSVTRAQTWERGPPADDFFENSLSDTGYIEKEY